MTINRPPKSASTIKMMLRWVMLFAAISPATSSMGGGRGSWGINRPALSVKQQVTTALPKTVATTVEQMPSFSTVLPENIMCLVQLRGGGYSSDAAAVVGNIPFQQIVRTIVTTITSTAKIVLPPIVATTRALAAFYRTLPKDAIIAQVGFVYCFCGGSYPTLFAAVQAAQVCGLHRMLAALSDLTDEAVIAVDAASSKMNKKAQSARAMFSEMTMVVMKSVDPVKINSACGALYTTWLGVSTVLEKEFAKTINYAVTLGNYIEPVMRKVVAPPVYLCVPKDYHRWVPICLGWLSKALAMRVAWRLQRVLTATTSAVLGGLMFSRAIVRMMHKQGFHMAGISQDEETTLLDEALGFTVAAAGIYVQLGDGKFDPHVAFPFTLLTWPFEVAENWIQWQITKQA
eukprot:CAMPEP_0119013712 /NCGR_PEP_ID=MMETSP1176-20130426/8801_1 /TAXON_ID=265551 /ORGANISM="Synedropsis recta cf, Strain CCMP1620" /LENGTH=401 /DNA_ID=CAMNT_0006966821 /DNA_START=44 /DNA_END=1249 /DNA_ORIENTATION=+